MNLTILENDAAVPPGHLLRVAAERGVTTKVVRLHDGEPIPDPVEVEAVVALGGEMGAYDAESYPYLSEEATFLADAVDLGIPVLGLCLGCQLLADALGGAAYLARRPEVVLGSFEMLTDDLVVSALASGPSLVMHRDTWVPPAGATLVGVSSLYNQAFRLGSALGVQAHPEVTANTLHHWLTDPGGAALAREAGADPDELIAACLASQQKMSDVADGFFGNWLAEAQMVAEAQLATGHTSHQS